MIRARLSIVLAAALAFAGAAQAQSGAFDMGGLTGTVSQDAVTQSEEQRANDRSDPSERARSSARAKANCAKRPQLRARYGADDPRLAMIDTMCRKLGY